MNPEQVKPFTAFRKGGRETFVVYQNTESMMNMADHGRYIVTPKKQEKPLVTFNKLPDVPVIKQLGMNGGGKRVRDVKYTIVTLKSKV